MREPLTPGRTARAVLVPALLAAAFAVGCNEQRSASAQSACSVRVIMRFTTQPDTALLAAIERTHAIELEPLEAITNELRVYTLRPAGSSDGCERAVERLRRDERVSSIDLDARRELHDE
jgi:hypothetical protein